MKDLTWWPAPRNRIAIVTHHKTGTVLFDQISSELAARLGWDLQTVRSRCDRIDPDATVLRFWHGTPDQLPPDPTLRVVHVVRDPREVIVSGYLYHRRTTEEWCVQTPPNAESDDPGFPFVPYALVGHPAGRRREWIESLDGRSYQANLLALDRDAGMLFELERYGRLTIDEMAAWTDTNDDERVITVRLEQIMSRYDDEIARIARHLGLRHSERWLFERIARRHDLSRRTSAERAANEHVHDPSPGRWKQYFTRPVAERFDERFGQALEESGDLER